MIFTFSEATICAVGLYALMQGVWLIKTISRSEEKQKTLKENIELVHRRISEAKEDIVKYEHRLTRIETKLETICRKRGEHEQNR
jgi:sensor domain CHASE-containing protein